MVSKLVKIALGTLAFVLVGSFSYNKVNSYTEYEKVYRMFRTETSGLLSPDKNDSPSTQEWATVCSEMKIEYRSTDGAPRPPIEDIRAWLKGRGHDIEN